MERMVFAAHFEPPFSADANFSVDAVFCTHNHLDHFQPDTICKLAASHPNVKFFVPAGILDEIQECIASFSDRVTGDTARTAAGIISKYFSDCGSSST